MERDLVERAGLKFEPIEAVGIRGKNPLAALGSLWTLTKGYLQSRQILRRFQPAALLVTGGYVCAPVTLAARQLGIPVIIYLPDIEPGLAIKFLARFASRVAVTTATAQQFFKPGLTVVTGYPVRPELAAAAARPKAQNQAQARRRLNLPGDLPILLVFGGSRGARSINRAVMAALEPLLRVARIIHVTGRLDYNEVQARRAKLPPELQARHHVADYLHHQMVDALLAADLVVSRAGASVLGEFPAAGLPAILAPYPYAGAHQSLNAEYLAKHQAAVIINNADLPLQLQNTVIELITNTNRLQAMSKASRNLAQPEAAIRLARAVLEVGTYGN